MFIQNLTKLSLLLVLLPTFVEAQDEIDFRSQIQPILAENCYACHGIDAESRAADLRLDIREDAIELGAIDLDDPAESSMLLRIWDEDDPMPPDYSHKKLTETEKRLLQKWVEQGAPYQKHWALIPPSKSDTPKTASDPWVKNEIDAYVLTKLRNQGLTPADEAQPEILFRRLCLDITGLPPKPAELQEFVDDYQQRGDEALSDWIDRLMDRPEWGEHRARYWLDAARYADTHGMHFDNYREMWPYRDWVIKSFNSNQPFDEFVIEQLAGDLLPSPTLNQMVATGFQRCGMTTNEGGTIDDENRAVYAADRVQTFGWVFLGLTTNCSQCHDHKYDPISMKDYYSLAAFFRNTTQPAKDGNAADGGGPVIVVPSQKDVARWKELPGEISSIQSDLASAKQDYRDQLVDWIARSKSIDFLDRDSAERDLLIHLSVAADGTSLNIENGSLAESCSPKFTSVSSDKEIGQPIALKPTESTDLFRGAFVTGENSIEIGDVGGFALDQPFSVSCWVKCEKRQRGAIVARMTPATGYRGWDLSQNDGEFSSHFVSAWPNNAIRISTQGNRVKTGKWQHVVLTSDGSGRPAGFKFFVDGQPVKTKVLNNTIEPKSNTIAETDLRLGSRAGGDHAFRGHVQDLMVHERALAATEIRNLAISKRLQQAAQTPADSRTKEMQKLLTRFFYSDVLEPTRKLHQQLTELVDEQNSIRSRSPITHVQTEKPGPAKTHMLLRGAYDNLGEEVFADTPAALHPFPKSEPKNRLGLAKWVVDPANPLTHRVTVNRIWQELFGVGIVATPEDFGVMGSPPVNQPLLDHLAIEFLASDWDIKRIYKKILMSATYRQSSYVTKAKLEKDPYNTFLSRGPRFRMDAEMLRDQALQVSGLLSQERHGYGVKPYQPPNLWDIVGLPGGNTRKYIRDNGEKLYRRSIYSFWKRMSPPANLEAFNAPNREVCTVRRERTNTPLQALVTLNDPQFVEAARVLAATALQRDFDAEPKTMQWIGIKALAREFNERELALLSDSLKSYSDYYADNPGQAKSLVAIGESSLGVKLQTEQLAAWTMVCNQILNLDEFLCK